MLILLNLQFTIYKGEFCKNVVNFTKLNGEFHFVDVENVVDTVWRYPHRIFYKRRCGRCREQVDNIQSR